MCEREIFLLCFCIPEYFLGGWKKKEGEVFVLVPRDRRLFGVESFDAILVKGQWLEIVVPFLNYNHLLPPTS